MTAIAVSELIEIALQAGVEILEVYHGAHEVTIKADDTPVTKADLRAERLILERLAALAPDIAVIAEEAAAKGEIPEIAARFFLVDPLDGSKEFIARNGEFTVNIALIENGAPVMGVVYAPASGTIWWGDANGAFAARVEDGGLVAQRAIACAKSAEGPRVVGSRSHESARMKDYLAGFANAQFIAVGSSLKFCLIAQGDADLYPRFGRTMEWDTAAGDAVLRAAGGAVTTLEAAPLVYGKKDADFANPDFLARGTTTEMDTDALKG